MTKEVPSNPASELQIGQMPEPRFLNIPSPFADGARPIGFEATSPVGGKRKTFIWWDNFTGANLAQEDGRDKAATFITRLIINNKAEIAVGPAISLRKSNVKTGKVSLSKGWPKEFGLLNEFGLYVEASKRPWFNFKYVSHELPSKEEVGGLSYADGSGNLITFNDVLRKVKSSLPRPVKKSVRLGINR